MTKRKPPLLHDLAEIASIEEAVSRAIRDDAALESMCFELDALESIEARVLDFSGCCFRRVQFADLHIARTHFTDCRFEQCDLSGLPFRDGTMTRVELIGCRGTGTSLDRLKLKDVLFEHCQLNYLTVADCQLERVAFSDCDLSHMMLFGTKQKELSLTGCRLNASEINATPLAGVNLSDCDLDGITAQGECLRGAVVSLAQAPAILGLFGIRVEL